MIFKNRQDAGQKLLKKLSEYIGDQSVIVLGLPRGGVVTANEIAKGLNAPLDILAPRKLGAPLNEELAIGAITEDGESILDQNIISTLGVEQKYIDQITETEKTEANRRLKKYRGDLPPLNLTDKTALIVDDGIATGATMQAAISSAKAKGAQKIVVAVPTMPKDVKKILEKEVDQLICLDTPLYFGAIGMFYKEFDQTSDEEVVELLK